MTTKFLDYEGIKNAITGTFEKTPNRNIKPVAVRLELKDNASTFQLIPTGGETRLPKCVYVDYGDNTPIDRTPGSTPHTFTWLNTPPKNPIVTLFFHRKDSNYITFGSEHLVDSAAISYLLSQVKTLLDPLPEWLALNNNIVINNEEFTAPNGFTNNLNLLPQFNGSTFTTGPKIWGSLEEFQYFPRHEAGIAMNAYKPFMACPNINKIEFQGTFSERIEQITRIDLFYRDENNTLKLDAYPNGGTPQVIKNYIYLTQETVGEVHMEYGLEFPDINCKDLKHSLDPIYIDNLRIGQLGTTPGIIKLPLGPKLEEASKLTLARNGVKNITIEWNNFFLKPDYHPDNIMYGMKILGIQLPKQCKKVYGYFTWERMTSNAMYYGYTATPDLLRYHINGALGDALEAYWTENGNTWGENEPLTPPNPPTNMEHTDDYWNAHHYRSQKPGPINDHWYTVQWNNDTEVFEPINIPPLPNTVKSYNSYCKDLYRNAIIGINLNSPFKHYESDPTDPNHDYTWEEFSNTIHIPKNPESIIRSIDYLAGTFKDSQGFNDRIETLPQLTLITSWTRNGPVNPREPLPPGSPEATDPGINVGLDIRFNVQSQPEVMNQLNDAYNSYWTDTAPGSNYSIFDYIPWSPEGVILETPDILIQEGIFIETGPLPNLEYAIRWQDSCFEGSVINPTSPGLISPLLVELPPGVKSEYAYRNALSTLVATPRLESWGNPSYDYDKWHTDSEKFKGNFLFTWPVWDQRGQIRTWDLTDLNLPNFTLTNTTGEVYNAFESIFNNTYHGEAKNNFFDTYTIDTSLTGLNAIEYIGGSSGLPNDEDIGGMINLPNMMINYEVKNETTPGTSINPGHWYKLANITWGPYLENNWPPSTLNPHFTLYTYDWLDQRTALNIVDRANDWWLYNPPTTPPMAGYEWTWNGTSYP